MSRNIRQFRYLTFLFPKMTAWAQLKKRLGSKKENIKAETKEGSKGHQSKLEPETLFKERYKGKKQIFQKNYEHPHVNGPVEVKVCHQSITELQMQAQIKMEEPTNYSKEIESVDTSDDTCADHQVLEIGSERGWRNDKSNSSDENVESSGSFNQFGSFTRKVSQVDNGLSSLFPIDLAGKDVSGCTSSHGKDFDTTNDTHSCDILAHCGTEDKVEHASIKLNIISETCLTTKQRISQRKRKYNRFFFGEEWEKPKGYLLQNIQSVTSSSLVCSSKGSNSVSSPLPTSSDGHQALEILLKEESSVTKSNSSDERDESSLSFMEYNCCAEKVCQDNSLLSPIYLPNRDVLDCSNPYGTVFDMKNDIHICDLSLTCDTEDEEEHTTFELKTMQVPANFNPQNTDTFFDTKQCVLSQKRNTRFVDQEWEKPKSYLEHNAHFSTFMNLDHSSKGSASILPLFSTAQQDTNNNHSKKCNEQEWHNVSSFKGTTIYRIRIFVQDSKTLKDKTGCLPSAWCLKKGYIAIESRMLPKHIKTSGKAQYFLKNSTIKGIVDNCFQFSSFPEKKSIKLYCMSYLVFCNMKEGDIVVMIMPPKKRVVRKGEAYFGVIMNNEIILKNPEEALIDDFPSPHLFDPMFRNSKFPGLLLRKVKWLRKGMIRSLPAQTTGKNGIESVGWLHETVPFYLMNVSKKARNVLQGSEFLAKTQMYENRE
uniref:Uncharacterized protein n=1 Tax=Corethron hystrix TaxID=216773 RepID=A0A7S1FST8_9STRA|mmetsp:Transcript_26251/g.60368  ORF Transcript_26251/g.60368 Transcript_26251/m.60368 type:complete len:708 (+) Transcript_26251:304-2427(+)